MYIINIIVRAIFSTAMGTSKAHDSKNNVFIITESVCTWKSHPEKKHYNCSCVVRIEKKNFTKILFFNISNLVLIFDHKSLILVINFCNKFICPSITYQSMNSTDGFATKNAFTIFN